MATRAATADDLDTDLLLQVLAAFRDGDFSARMPEHWTGVPGKIADALNDVIVKNQRFNEEVTRLRKVVGQEGRISHRISTGGTLGGWASSIHSVNDIVEDLLRPNTETARVITAVANGDLSQTVPLEVDGVALQGQFARTARTVNTMVSQLSSFSSEVTRVAREVGTEGKLGGQARVRGVGGVWKDLTDSVNTMAGNLTSQVRNIAEVTTAVANGDLSKKITVEGQGEILELKNTINVMVDQLNGFSSEVTRVAREVGTEGKLGGQAHVRGVGGVWKELTDNVNLLAGQLTNQIRNIAEVTTAVARGDLSRKVTVDVQGEILELKNTINVMVDQLNAFAGEVARVAFEVGTEGKLGGQARVPGASGTWKDLTDNVNLMAANLTDQVRGIAGVVTAVADGDLRRKLAVEAKGEIAALSQTINGMTDTLATFAEQVTTVAREVGVDGRLGGQASVPGASGTWKDLTDNVNQLAATLTDQIRAIADVATAVTEGDLTRSIGVEASGEVAVLKDKINEMIRNLRETTGRNQEQDWLKTNLTHFTRTLQGQRNLVHACQTILSQLAPLINAQHGVFYTLDISDPEGPVLRYQAGYAHRGRDGFPGIFRIGEGLVGQCALERERILLTNVPGNYITISSGLGEAPPLDVVVQPVIFEGQVLAVLELASFERFAAIHLDFLGQLTESIAIVLNTIEANTRTERLLEQSQQLATELQVQQEELRHTNEELGEKAHQLEDRNIEVERKNQEVEQARRSLEEKAEQLALTSKYKSEFLANMSHELRTPLNSLLILAQQLSENPNGNLTPRQVEFANIIMASGQDLLHLINDILDISKIESGTVALEVGEESFASLRDVMDRDFRHIADARSLGYEITIDPVLPGTLRTDSKRLRQVLKNLLSNAFKFTERGRVELSMRLASNGWDADLATLKEASQVVAFDVVDTGIGIPPDKQMTIFEAFQQSDGTTSRKYGGTGLGLTISRELARLLGGEIRLRSAVGVGSSFTVYLPIRFAEQVASGTGVERVPPRELTEPAGVLDDRERLEPADSVVLIVDDDTRFCRVLLDLAHESGFKGIVAEDGRSAISLARVYRPAAVILDIGLPDTSGWQVLETLRGDPLTKSIPVHVVTVFDDARERVSRQGAISFLPKPADKRQLENLFSRIQAMGAGAVRHVLLIEDDPVQRQPIADVLRRSEIVVHEAASGEAALALARRQPIDCVILDLMLPGMTGFELLERFRKSPKLRRLPVVVYTAADLSAGDAAMLAGARCSVVVKGDKRSRRRLLDQVGRFLTEVGDPPPNGAAATSGDGVHPPAGSKPASRPPAQAVDAAELSGRTVLVVDDDVRNVFALTAVLERHGMRVMPAEGGREAIEALEAAAGQVDAVLLDIMMPDVDGYETLRRIRSDRRFADLPIIALTAKAMKGDRERCLEAGATDYIAKPMESGRLLRMLLQHVRVQ